MSLNILDIDRAAAAEAASIRAMLEKKRDANRAI